MPHVGLIRDSWIVFAKLLTVFYLHARREKKIFSFSHQICNKDLISFVCLFHFTSENWLCFQALFYYFRWFRKFFEKIAKIYKDFVTSTNNGNFDRIDRRVGRCWPSDIDFTFFLSGSFLFSFVCTCRNPYHLWKKRGGKLLRIFLFSGFITAQIVLICHFNLRIQRCITTFCFDSKTLFTARLKSDISQ